MESTMEHINKFREERIAKEKARIEKLRELNLKKYNKNDYQPPKKMPSSISLPVKCKSDTSCITKNITNPEKKSLHLNGTGKRLTYVPLKTTSKEMNVIKNNKAVSNDMSVNKSKANTVSKSDVNIANTVVTDDKTQKPLKEITAEANSKSKNSAQSAIPKRTQNLNGKNVTDMKKFDGKRKTLTERKSIIKPNVKLVKSDGESVFDRLYKPKVIPKQSVDNALKLRTDPSYLKKVIKDSQLIVNKRHTVFENKPIRRSISAVHFKKISKNELGNCVHKWASIGEKINKVHVKDTNEDEAVKDEKIISAVKSERKRVKFQTPMHLNFNTPKPEELQTRLQNWLKRRGKSIDSYHHLQCFGLHHLPKEIKPLNLVEYDDENKENLALEHDSDNDSYLDNMNNVSGDINKKNKGFPTDKWRRASSVADSVDFNDSYETTLNYEGVNQVDELLLGALNDLTDLLKEGFDWEQCARWLRAIRDRYSFATDKAAYWECRAALEERRGDLPASVQCWEQAIAAGTAQSVVEANLDNLLDKFMQLKISPSSGKRHVDPKLVDVKNVFKSTIIRFAVQQAKLRQSTEKPKYTVTPVRRSSRLSTHWRTQTPVRVCTTIHQATELGAEFRPNKALVNSP